MSEEIRSAQHRHGRLEATHICVEDLASNCRPADLASRCADRRVVDRSVRFESLPDDPSLTTSKPSCAIRCASFGVSTFLPVRSPPPRRRILYTRSTRGPGRYAVWSTRPHHRERRGDRPVADWRPAAALPMPEPARGQHDPRGRHQHLLRRPAVLDRVSEGEPSPPPTSAVDSRTLRPWQ